MSVSPHPRGIAGTSWDPTAYLAFGDQRLRPAVDLLGRIPLEAPERIWDLGCGTGHVTRMLAARWPGARVTGLDHSREMLERAASEPSAVQWVAGDITTWSPDAPADLLYANAALHWVGDHAVLFPRLTRALRAAGCLAVQMPLSWDLPSHRLMRETLANGGPDGGPLGSEALRAAVATDWVEPSESYFEWLSPLARQVDIWQTEYLQLLEGEDAVLEWVKGTGLRPILHGLEPPARSRFLDEYRRRLAAAYPRRADGRTLYPFRRLFIVAVV